jgi:hypothetical protein
MTQVADFAGGLRADIAELEFLARRILAEKYKRKAKWTEPGVRAGRRDAPAGVPEPGES